MFPGLPNPWLILGVMVTFLAAVTAAFFEGESIQKTADQVAVDQLKIDAANQLATATQKVLDLEHARDAYRQQLEKENADHKAQIAFERSRTLDVISANHGLRVPGQSGGSCDSTVPSANKGPGTPATTISYCLIDEDVARRLAEAAAQSESFLADLKSAQRAFEQPVK